MVLCMLLTVKMIEFKYFSVQIFLSIIILYINVLICLSLTLVAKLKYFFWCLILFLWARELHKNVQEGGNIIQSRSTALI